MLLVNLKSWVCSDLCHCCAKEKQEKKQLLSAKNTAILNENFFRIHCNIPKERALGTGPGLHITDLIKEDNSQRTQPFSKLKLVILMYLKQHMFNSSP